MAKSKKNAKKSSTEVDNTVAIDLIRIEQQLNEVKVPGDLQERFNPQIERVCNRIGKIAKNLSKAIELGATKAERDAKKAARKAARKEKLEAQIKATQAKLDALEN